jgi:DNA repair exonuclease SbcCD ATPase subunit
MRMLGQVIAVIAILHVLAGAAFVGYLGVTHRLSRERLAQVKAIFALSVADQEAADEQAAAKAKAADEEAARLSRAAGLASASAAETLEAQRQRDELMLLQLQRTRREIEDLQQNMQLTRKRMEKERDQLQAMRKEAEARLEALRKELDDEGFKNAIVLYEQLPPKQVKQIFLDMMRAGDTTQVATILHAMEARKASGVLREFKDMRELPQAAELMNQLRTRGTDLVAQLEAQP